MLRKFTATLDSVGADNVTTDDFEHLLEERT